MGQPRFGQRPRRESKEEKYARVWVKAHLKRLYRAGICYGEPAAHLYLLLATEIEDDRYVTNDILVQDLVAWSHTGNSSVVNRALRTLAAEREIERLRGGQGDAYVRFAFLKMAGPLYVAEGGAAARTSISPIE